MTSYWLTPIVSYSPLALGADRIHCLPLDVLETFRELAGRKHPRLLPLFKASLLLSDDEELCGSEFLELDVAQPQEIVFDGKPFHLSHCAEAFLDRLLSREEALELVNTLVLSDDVDDDTRTPHSLWKREWQRWLASGFDVILLREDG